MVLKVFTMLSTPLKDIADKLNLINEETMYVVDFFEFMDAPLGTKGGKVCDFAPHEELLEKKESLYYKMFMAQAENYQM